MSSGYSIKSLISHVPGKHPRSKGKFYLISTNTEIGHSTQSHRYMRSRLDIRNPGEEAETKVHTQQLPRYNLGISEEPPLSRGFYPAAHSIIVPRTYSTNKHSLQITRKGLGSTGSNPRTKDRLTPDPPTSELRRNLGVVGGAAGSRFFQVKNPHTALYNTYCMD